MSYNNCFANTVGCCPQCRGTGYYGNGYCTTCHGRGYAPHGTTDKERKEDDTQHRPKTIDEHQGNKYLRLIHSARLDNTRPPISVDVYAVLVAFNVTCPARQHAIKKLLCCGNRDKGGEMADLIGAEAAISRAIELQKIKDEYECASKIKDTVNERAE